MKLAKLSMPRRPVRGSRMSSGSGIGSQTRIRSAETPYGELVREEVVGDAHLVAVGVGAEREQRRVLRLPSEAADAPLAGGDVDDDGRAAADAVAVAIDRILEREQRLVRNRLDEPGAEERDRHAARERSSRRRASIG